MRLIKKYHKLIPVYVLVVLLFVIASILCNQFASVFSGNVLLENKNCIIIDAGHGGVDGGATSCTGVLESNMNLEIAIKLNDLLNFLGYSTKMIRTEDVSVYTEGNSIAQKKVSDLKQRVSITKKTKNPILISIHQNYFIDPKYNGAQVFYAPTDGSKTLATILQNQFKSCLNKNSKRDIKKADSVYLMQNISCPGVLIECGFLSNAEEEFALRNKDYQQEICCVIASSISEYLKTNGLS